MCVRWRTGDREREPYAKNKEKPKLYEVINGGSQQRKQIVIELRDSEWIKEVNG